MGGGRRVKVKANGRRLRNTHFDSEDFESPSIWSCFTFCFTIFHSFFLEKITVIGLVNVHNTSSSNVKAVGYEHLIVNERIIQLGAVGKGKLKYVEKDFK